MATPKTDQRYLVQHLTPLATKSPYGGSTHFTLMREACESPLGERVIAGFVLESRGMIWLRHKANLTF